MKFISMIILLMILILGTLIQLSKGNPCNKGNVRQHNKHCQPIATPTYSAFPFPSCPPRQPCPLDN